MLKKLFLAISLVLPPLCATAADDAASAGANSNLLWKDVAEAAVVAVGQYSLSDSDKNSLNAGEQGYLEINLKLGEILKGTAPDGAILRYYNQDTSYLPKRSELMSLNGTLLMFFLKQPHISAPERLYLQNFSPLQSATADAIGVTKAEILRQKIFLDNWKNDTSVQGYKQVQKILKKIKTPESQAAAFVELENLGVNLLQ
jgi:hypothetical protein